MFSKKFVCILGFYSILQEIHCKACSSPCYTYMETIGSCIKLSAKTLNWTMAAEECKKDGGHLVVLNTPEKLLLIWQKVKNLKLPWWIGAYRLSDDGSYIWINGNNTTQNNFGVGTGYGCGMIRSDITTTSTYMQLTYTYCSEGLHYICETFLV